MAHMYLINEKDTYLLKRLFTEKINGQYIVLSEGGGFSDIAQFCEKYQNVKVITVPTSRLNSLDRLK